MINHIQRDLEYPTGATNLANVKYLFEAAEYIGKISQQVQQDHGMAFAHSGVSGETTLLLGGQIAGKPHGLMLIYPQGNYITSSPQTPYLQIGESKYGKPALDRISYPGLSLEEGASLTLVSLDATTRSNISVGPPFEVAIYKKDSLQLECRCSFDETDPYLISMREAWNTGINNVFNSLPVFEKNKAEPSVEVPVVAVPAAPVAPQSEQMIPTPMPGQFT